MAGWDKIDQLVISILISHISCLTSIISHLFLKFKFIASNSQQILQLKMAINKNKKIASELSVTEKQVQVTINLLEEGGTVPFIARYRKEMTGSLDEVQVAAIRDRNQQLV